jgi:hypothetical protein
VFFFLDEKELRQLCSTQLSEQVRGHGKRPTPICPKGPSQNGGSLSFAKISRTITNVCSGVYDTTRLFLNMVLYAVSMIKPKLCNNDFVQ